MASDFSQGDRFVVTFEGGRDGSPMTRVNGKIAFPERGGKLPKVGETWEVELAGTNPRGTVHFLRLIRRVGRTVESVANPVATGEAPEALTLWRTPRGDEKLEGPILADRRRGADLFSVEEFSLAAARDAGCPEGVVAAAEKGVRPYPPLHSPVRWSDAHAYDHVHSYGGLAGQPQTSFIGSISYGADRSRGSGWLTPNAQWTINTVIERPRVGVDGEGRTLLEMPLGWGFFLMTARGLSVQVLDQDEGVVIQSVLNAFAMLAPFGKGANLSIGWYKKAGKWSRDHSWQGRIVIQPEGIERLAEPAPADMQEL